MAETVKESDLAQGQVETPYGGLAQVKAIVAFASAKGGTGKSTIVANIAAALALKGRKVAVVDGDFDAPSLAPMLGVPRVRLTHTQGALEPASGPFGIRIVANDPLAAETPLLFGLDNSRPEPVDFPPEDHLGQFTSVEDLIGRTRFGALDLLLVDLPPGFKHAVELSESIERTGVVIVLPSSASGATAVRHVLQQARRKEMRILGLIENMAGFYCGNCHSVRPLLPSADMSALGRDFDLPILARFPFDPRLAEACDNGRAFLREYPDLPLSKLLNEAAQTLLTSASAARAAART
jgi:ATP-binding protein involved in chromosome partitioning